MNLLDFPPTNLFNDYQVAAAPRLGVSQDVSFNAAGGAQTLGVAFGSTTQMVQITVPPSSGTGVRIAIASNPTVGATGAQLPPGAVVYYRVYPGEKIAVLSDDANTGHINVVECATRSSP